MIEHPEDRPWFVDQLTKSAFFHQKLHEWKMLPIAEAIEAIRGEDLSWEKQELGITESAWNKVIHRGIKPVTVFAHPQVLIQIRGATSYYRMLSMVSQKSMGRVGLPVTSYETGSCVPEEPAAKQIACHLNLIISRLIDTDVQINPREFDLWRGMAAGTQAQGSWQNAKGQHAELLIKGLIKRRLFDAGWVSRETEEDQRLELSDGRIVSFGSEPDVAFYKRQNIQAAVEVKGGIDSAGVLERLGAAMKSLSRTREKNPTAVTILVFFKASLTEKAKQDLELNRKIITHWFTVEELLNYEFDRQGLSGA
ncbi:MAG TPA: XcyI family restriction endonuclease [Thermogutta sp.]|nr:XcyI family restriction endonuclease [Thermogutta sp.]